MFSLITTLHFSSKEDLTSGNAFRVDFKVVVEGVRSHETGHLCVSESDRLRLELSEGDLLSPEKDLLGGPVWSLPVQLLVLCAVGTNQQSVVWSRWGRALLGLHQVRKA